MRAVYCQKISLAVYYPQEFCKSYYAPAAITTHTAGLTVRVIVYHFKIVPINVLQKHHTIPAYAKPSVAQTGNKRRIMMVYNILAIIYQNKIIARALVFIEFNFHLLFINFKEIYQNHNR